MNNRILILGSSSEFGELVKILKKRGIYTAVCDGNKDGPAKHLSDKKYDVPLTDIDAIADICVNEQVDGVLSAYSDMLLECMTAVCAKANLPCYLKPDQLIFYRDKRAMKQMFKDLDIDCAKSVILTPGFNDCELKNLRFPVVVKPVDSYGSRGIFVLDNAGDVRKKFYDICRYSDIKEAIAEEYCDGFEFNAMSWLCEGHVNILGIADREKTAVLPEAVPYNSRNVYPSFFLDEIYEEAKNILSKVASYTGQKNGELSIQFFRKPGCKIQVGEVSARFLGYEHELIEYAGGFSIEELLIDSVYDNQSLVRRLKSHSARFLSCAAVIYFQAEEGRVNDISMLEDLKSYPGVKHIEIFYGRGDYIAPFKQPYAARIMIAAKSREEIDKLTEKIIGHAAMYDDRGRNLLYKNSMLSYSV